MKSPIAALWKKSVSQKIIVTKNDGKEYTAWMVTIRSLVQQTRTQLLGTTKIDHLIVNDQIFTRMANDLFRSNTGEIVTLTRLN